MAVPLTRNVFAGKRPYLFVVFSKRSENVLFSFFLHKTTRRYSYRKIFAVLSIILKLQKRGTEFLGNDHHHHRHHHHHHHRRHHHHHRDRDRHHHHHHHRHRHRHHHHHHYRHRHRHYHHHHRHLHFHLILIVHTHKGHTHENLWVLVASIISS